MGKTLDQYRSEANVSAFVLTVDENTEITVPPPDGDTFMGLSEIRMDDPRGLLRALCGDQYDAVMDVLGKESIPVLLAVVKDMLGKFGLTDVGAGPGGRVALPR